jgi:hypothetical protein
VISFNKSPAIQSSEIGEGEKPNDMQNGLAIKDSQFIDKSLRAL